MTTSPPIPDAIPLSPKVRKERTEYVVVMTLIYTAGILGCIAIFFLRDETKHLWLFAVFAILCPLLIGFDIYSYVRNGRYKYALRMDSEKIVRVLPSGKTETYQWENLVTVGGLGYKGNVFIFRAPSQRDKRLLVDSVLCEISTPLGEAIVGAISQSPAADTFHNARIRALAYARWRMHSELNIPRWHWFLYALLFAAGLIVAPFLAQPDARDWTLAAFIWSFGAFLLIGGVILFRISNRDTKKRLEEFDREHPEIKPLLDSGEITFRWWQVKP